MLLFLSIITLSIADAQKQSNATGKSTTAETLKKEDIPPPMEEMQLADLITFDTTAVVNNAFSADIRQLMNAMQFKETLIKTVSQALDQSITQLPLEYRSVFKEKFMKELTDGPALGWMENIFIKNYQNVFNQSEIKELIQFYKTELGKKFIDKAPELTVSIMQDSQKIGAYIGYKVGKEITNANSKNTK